jgi:hypothetical protein
VLVIIKAESLVAMYVHTKGNSSEPICSEVSD